MKLTKKLEAEVLKFYKAYWDTYLNGDMKTLASILDDNVTVFGTAISETFHNKKDALKFYTATADQLIGKAQMRNRKINLQLVDNNVLINERCDFYFLLDKKWTYYGHVRISAVVKHTITGWKVIQQHASFPDMRADEGEQLAAEKIKEENLQLRDAVKRRTVELEEKNQELEIEAALERVRTVAMSMRSSNDLISVCKVMNEELIKLGFTNIRNSQIAINNDDRQLYVNYEYSAYDGESITDVSYNSHRTVNAMVKKMKASKNAFFSVKITGKELNEWRRFRIKLGQKKDKKLAKAKAVCYYFYSVGNGALGISTFDTISKEQLLQLQRFRNVFVLAYKRFTDIQNAEAQTKEAQIEAALEKVRARTMGMHSSNELGAVIKEVTDQLQLLGFDFDTSNIATQIDNKGFYLWNSVPGEHVLAGVFVPKIKNRIVDWFSGNRNLVSRSRSIVFNKKDTNDFFKYYLALDSTKQIPADRKKFLISTSSISLVTEYRKDFTLSVLNYRGIEYSERESQILTRFANVFEQAYTRFLDLQKAEAQAREAEIQLALERVRARSLAMHDTSELQNIVNIVAQQLHNISIDINGGVIIAINDEVNENLPLWASAGAADYIQKVEVPLFDKPIFTDLRDAIKKGNNFFTGEYSRKEKIEFFKHLFKYPPWNSTTEERKKQLLSREGGLTRSAAISRHTSIGVTDHYGKKFSDLENDILKRFGNVFEQSYTRFLDLQRAEAQAREAQIETSLEKVRSRSLAMHTSGEIQEVVNCVFERLTELGVSLDTANIMIASDDTNDLESWTTNKNNQYRSCFRIPYKNLLYFNDLLYVKRSGLDLLAKKYSRKEKDKIFNFLFTETDFKYIPEERKKFLLDSDHFTISAAIVKNIIIQINSYTLEAFSENENEILKRMAHVFEQAYTRFLDLQKAEAQAREAQIETGLERVRSKTMAMHKSSEVTGIAVSLNEELLKLGFEGGSTILIMDKKTGDTEQWTGFSENKTLKSCFVPHFKHPYHDALFDNWKNGEKFLIYTVAGNEKRSLDAHYFSTGYKIFPESDKKWMKRMKSVTFSHAFMKYGAIHWGPGHLTEEQLRILERFSKVFEQSYTRFLDLQKAEAQAREAQIQLSLERVRARAMAMYHSDELNDVLSVLFEQFDALGINPVFAHLSLFDLEKNLTTLRITGKGGKRSLAQKTVAIDAMDEWKEELANWKASKPSSFSRIYYPKEVVPQIWNLFGDLFDQLPGDSKIYPDDFPDGLYCMQGNTGFGYIGLNHTREIIDEEKDIILRFATEFGRVYQRFLDLKKAEAQAREAQIEAALEKIRSRSLAMHSSTELKEVIAVTFEKLNELNVLHGTVSIQLFDWEKMNSFMWVGNNIQHPQMVNLPYDKKMMNDNSLIKDEWQAMKEGVDMINKVYSFKQKNRFFNYIFSHNDLIQIPESARKLLLQMKSHVVCLFTEKNSALFVDSFNGELFTADEQKIIKRTAKVFEQAYIRFLDLQKAEAQAREAEIELALERVRARAMAMQKPAEFVEVINVIGEQFVHLGFDIEWVNFGAHGLDVADGIDTWNFAVIPGGDPVSSRLFIPRFDHPVFNDATRQLDNYRKTGNDLFVMSYGKKVKDRWLDHLFTKTFFKDVPEEYRAIQYAKPGYTTSNLALKDTFLSIGKFDLRSFTDEQNSILRRFGKAFGQAYTRFQDLQKAEAQAREAKIEAALEKIRSRSLAMHHSDELREVIGMVYTMLSELKVKHDTVAIQVFDFDNNSSVLWPRNTLQNVAPKVMFPYDKRIMKENACHRDLWEAMANGKSIINKVYTKQEKDSWFEYIFANNDYTVVEEHSRQFLLQLETFTVCFFPERYSGLYAESWDGTKYSEEDIDVLKRSARVFEQAYVRFLDLQKAEAQARESQIQLALERVRARTMAMQKSDELPETSHILFEQMKELGEPVEQLTIGVVQEENKVIEISATLHGDILKKIYHHSIDEPFMMSKIYHAWKTHQKTLIVELKGDELNAYNKYRNELTKSEMFPTNLGDEHRRIVYAAFFSKGMLALGANEPRPPESLQLLERFAGVFDQAYIRFIDLKNAEAQAREAQIEAALEKVRSRSLAMHKSDELKEAGELLWNELGKLGIESLSSGYVLMDKEEKIGWIYAPNPATGKIAEPLGCLHTETKEMLKVLSCWKKQEPLSIVEMNEQETIAHQTFVAERGLQPDGTISHWITAEQLIALSPKRLFLHNFNFKQGYLLIVGGNRLTDKQIELMLRFTNVFQQTYTRFLDLQKAEAQARESQIEAALERVRSRTMAMQKSEELAAVATVLFQQVKALGVPQWVCGFSIWEIGDKEYTWYPGSPEGEILTPCKVPLTEHPVFISFDESRKRGDELFIYEKEGEFQEDHYRYMKTIPGMRDLLQNMLDAGQSIPTFQIDHIANFSHGNLVFITYEHVPEMHDVFKRFAKVFDQTYTRFLDLQKAELQAREAQIETALERVRSRTMAMHQTSELQEVIHTVHKELLNLDLSIDGGSFVVINDDVDPELRCWGSGGTANTSEEVHVPHFNMPFCTNLMKGIKKGPGFFTEEFSQKEKKEYFTKLFEHKPWSDLSNEQKEETLSSTGGYTRSVAVSKHTSIFIINHHGRKFTEIENDILQRFGKVFEQTYTRFLDLQKAEAQARESQIQLALERVRARTMAMQKSEELGETAFILFQQFKELGEDPVQITIGIFNEDEKKIEFSITGLDDSGSKIDQSFKMDIGEPILMSGIYKGWKEQKTSAVFELSGKELSAWITYRNKQGGLPQSATQINYEEIRSVCAGYFSKGFISFSRSGSIQEETIKILERFAGVFDLTYTRFLDLKQAESQAKEAQIQLALERVRARTMAMQKSDELLETSFLLFQQVKELGETTVQNSIGIVNEEAGVVELSTTVHGHHMPHILNVPIDDPYVMAKAVAAWKAKRKSLNLEFRGQELKDYNDHRNSFFETKVNFPEDQWLVSIVFFSQGWLSFSSDKAISAETFEILKRFAAVFEQTYIRFTDLKQAEAQAREAKIEVALERVRSRAMAMQSSEELNVLIGTVFTELTKLDLILTRCIIWIFDPATSSARWWMANGEEPSNPMNFLIKYHEHPAYLTFVNEWKKQNVKFIYDLKGQDKKNWDDILFNETELINLPDIVKNGMKSPERVLLSASFNNFGGINVASLEPLSDEHFDILLRFAKVFDLTYTRFNDLKQAEAQSKESRIQLALERVRARTMAMQKSDELSETSYVLFQQFRELGEGGDQIGIGIFEEDEKAMKLYSTFHGSQWNRPARIEFSKHRVYQNVYSAWKDQKRSVVTELTGKELEDLNKIKLENPDYQVSENELAKDHWAVCTAFFSNGILSYASHETPQKESIQLLERFATVFDLTYTRFLDLQKAEAQTREAQIELALERVRARTMAMHRSDELAETAQVLFHQLNELGAVPDRIAIGIADEINNVVNFWSTDQAGSHISNSFKGRLDERTVMSKGFKAWKDHQRSLIVDLQGDDLKEWIRFAKEEMKIPVKEEFIKGRRVHNFAFFSHGWILVTTHEPQSTETIQTLERFASVFSLTYRRFLDLQKAEEQAKEAQIELGLERVRARAMAMQKSDELADAAQLLYHEFGNLGINTISCGYMFIDEAKHTQTAWVVLPDGSLLPNFIVFPLTGDHVLDSRYKDWKEKKPLHIFEIQGEVNKEHHRFLSNYVPPFVVENIFSQIPDRVIFHCANFSDGYLLILASEFFSPEEQQTILRFAKVFEMTYTRFNDLKQAEAQAREAQIEVSLERVRAKAMAMHSSKDLGETLNVFYRELKSLSVTPIRCGVALMDKEVRKAEVTTMNTTEHGDSIEIIGTIKMSGHPVLDGVYDNWLAQKEYHAVLRGNQIKEYYQVLKPQISYLDYSHDEVQFGYYFMFKEGDVYAWTEKELTEDELNIYRRFTTVISLTYKRYKDLQQAEAQAREAKIEAGLERVRARTMAMHSSDDVGVATATMFTELEKLGIENLRGGITIIKPDQTQEVWSVTNMSDGRTVRAIGVFDMKLHPLWRGLLDGKIKNDDYLYYWMAGQDKEDYINILNATPNYLAQPIKEFPDVHVQSYFFGEGAVWTNSLQPHSEEDKQVMKRFASVFSLTFRRYQDLKKAEAQAREAQIEMALEKIRASTMAMQKSEDLSQAAFVLFKQFKELGESPERMFIATFDTADENLVDLWGTNQGGNQLNKLFRVSADEPTVIKKIVNAWREKKSSVVIDLTGDDLKNYLQFLENMGIPVTPGVMTERRVQTVACFSKGVIGVTTPEPRPAASIQLLERFANVFDLTYTRFLDLLQAEAQAREATIEAALEKVRGKAMAMHNSNDLSVTASIIFTELRKLGINPIRCGVGLLSKESRRAQLYSAGDNLSLIGWVQLTDHPVLEKIYDTWLNNKEYYPELEGEQMRLYYEQLLKGLPVTPPDTSNSPKHYGHFIPFSIGCLYAWADQHYDDADIRILKRFASIIDLTFRRYVELQKSEANAREAVKQAALDRVRADIASMRTIADLDRITPLIWNELTILGIPFIRCGVFIMDETQQFIHTFLSTPDGKAIGAFHLPYNTPGNIQFVLGNWREKKKYVDHWDEGEFRQFAHILLEQGALDSAENYLKTIPHGGFYLHFLPFLQGMLYVGNTTQLSGEMVDLVQAVADAFSTAYARYEDFNRLEAAKKQVENTLTDLKQAQQQLVQSEKMASLGELTAGIAHEIQNPLNFVNNFSDVSNELLEEMKHELEKGNKEDAIAIVEDVKQNLEKILHHGKRADAIVKGMLQHSRINSGQKEMTDINALTDEYLRLAFHGLRAKDKTFNAKFETHFDTNIEKINIIPQDIGRVILNLINNAFYAVTEKKKVNQNGYEPTVTVTTQKDNGKIEIKVKDNGSGIPQKILDKIFQPFFTTKPTGQGTGLGLSLAYDIVTKGHSGELKVETKEGEGSEFIIQLPLN